MRRNPALPPRAALALAAALLLFPTAALPTAGAPATAAAPPSPAAVVPTSGSPFFENYSAASGLSANLTILDAARANKEYNQGFLNGGRGACWFDYDNDGDDDLFVVGPGQDQLFRNDGGWNFTDVTTSAGLNGTAYGMGCAAGDLNNDGFEDLWITNYDSPQGVFRNNGNGTFTNVTAGSLRTDASSHTGVAFGDFDKDGLLDVFVTNYNRQQDRIYRNLGNFSFEERWNASGMFDLDFGFQPLVYDYNMDGNVDVYVINDFGFDRMWENEGNWSFRDVSSALGGLDARGGMGGDVADLDHNGNFELYVTNFQENGLWVQNGSGLVDRAHAAGVDNDSTGWAAAFFDYNNDGWDDLYVVNGGVTTPSDRYQANVLYEGLGNLTFADVTSGSGAESREGGRGAALADVDGDGRVDIYVTNNNAPNEMLRNVCNTSNAWVNVKLQGTVSNRDGVGAVVKVKAQGQTYTKPLLVGSGYLSTNSKVMHFGLGNATGVDSVEVDWPSGLKQTVLSPPLNATHLVVEADGSPPVGVAGDVAAKQGVAFELNGSRSTDNVGIARYVWTVDENGTLRTAAGPVASMTLYTPGNFSATLEVRDVFGNLNMTGFTVRVAPYNAAWVDAGPDFSVPEGTPHTFAAAGGSSETPDFENSSTFAWTFTEGGVSRALTGPRPSWTFTAVGVVEVHVRVTDIANNSADDFVNVTVLDITAPVVRAVVPAQADEDTAVALDASGTTDNDPAFPGGATFAWAYTDRGGPVAFSGANTSHVFADPGLFTITLTVADGAGNRAGKAFAIHILDRTAPVADAGQNATIDPGGSAVLSALNSTDNSADFFMNGTFTWYVHFRSEVVVLNGSLQVVRFPDPGVYAVELFVADPSGNAAASPAVLTITVRDTVPPFPSAGGDRSVDVGATVALDASNSTDNDPDFLATGTFVWEFQDGAVRQKLVGRTVTYRFESAGAYRIRLSAFDASGNSAAALFTVTASDLEPPRLLVAAVPAEVFTGVPLVLNATGTTDNVGVVSISWRVRGPFAFDAAVDGAAGSVVLNLPGTYNATVSAFDAAGNSATRSFTVRAVPAPPPVNGTGNGTNAAPPPAGGTPPPQGGAGPPGGSPAAASAAVIVGALAAAVAAAALALRQRRARGKEPPQSG